MCEAILFRNKSNESEEVARILHESDLNFTSVFSLSEKEQPTLIVQKNLYSFRGKARISEYMDSKKDPNPQLGNLAYKF